MRRIELGLGVIAVGLSAAAVADSIQKRSIEPGDDNAIMAGIGDKQAIAGLVGQDLARKTKRRASGPLALGFEDKRFFIEQTQFSDNAQRRVLGGC